MVRAAGKLTPRSIFMRAFAVLVTFLIGFAVIAGGASDASVSKQGSKRLTDLS